MGASLYFAEINGITKVTFERVTQRKHSCFVEETVGPEPIRCKGACISMHSTVQHFHPGEHNCLGLFWDLLVYILCFQQQEDMSRGSCTKESSDTSDHSFWALNPESDGTVPRPFSPPFLLETEGQTSSIHKLFNPNPPIIMICT